MEKIVAIKKNKSFKNFKIFVTLKKRKSKRQIVINKIAIFCRNLSKIFFKNKIELFNSIFDLKMQNVILIHNEFCGFTPTQNT